jgi:hypothetical protein
MICILTQYCWGVKMEKNKMGGTCSSYGGREGYTGFWCGNLMERDHFEDAGVDGKIILRRIFRKEDVGVWSGSSWLRIGTDGRHL